MINISSKNSNYERDVSKRHRSYKTKHDDLLLQRPTILSKSRSGGGSGDPEPKQQAKMTIINKKDENSKPVSKSESYDTIKAIAKLETDLGKLVLKPANQQSAPKPILIPKDPINQFNTSVHARLSPSNHMKTPCKLLDDNLQFMDTFDQFLSDTNDSYVVIGVLGKKGVGKSTLMSLISGCDDTCLFKPSTEHETAQHKTNGIDCFITKERTILLDIQPMLSASILEKTSDSNKKGMEFKYHENYIQIQSIELACFCLSVCNVVVLMEDWFLDPNLVTLIHTAEMLLPNMTDQTDQLAYEHKANLVYCLNKCEYVSRVDLIKMKSVFGSLMKDSKLNYKGLIGADANSNPSMLSKAKKSQRNADELNFVVLPSFKNKNEHNLGEMREFNGMPSMERSIKTLVKDLLSVKRASVSQQSLLSSSTTGTQNQPSAVFSEKKWFAYTQKVWDTIKKSSFISEYSRLMT